MSRVNFKVVQRRGNIGGGRMIRGFASFFLKLVTNPYFRDRV